MEILKGIGIVVIMALFVTFIFSFFGFFVLLMLGCVVLVAVLNLLGVPVRVTQNDVLIGHLVHWKYVPLKK